jgi:exonuclease III
MSAHPTSLKDLKTHIDSNTVRVGDFNILLSITDRSSRQKDTTDLMELTDVCRVFHPAKAQYTFFSAAHGTFSKTGHILGHKAILHTV